MNSSLKIIKTKYSNKWEFSAKWKLPFTCPVDCIHPTKDEGEFEKADMLYIDPDTCIDCGLCVDECPVTAIYPEEDLPEEWQKYIEMNAEWYVTK